MLNPLFVEISFQSSVEDVINFIEGHPNKDGIAMEILKRYMSITWNGKVYPLLTLFANLSLTTCFPFLGIIVLILPPESIQYKTF